MRPAARDARQEPGVDPRRLLAPARRCVPRRPPRAGLQCRGRRRAGRGRSSAADDAADAGLDQRPGAGRRPAVMRARLERDIGGGAARAAAPAPRASARASSRHAAARPAGSSPRPTTRPSLTITQPTGGVRPGLPQRRRPAQRMGDVAPPSFERLGRQLTFPPWRGAQLARRTLSKSSGRLEILVDAGEADIGDRVDAGERFPSRSRRSACEGMSVSPMLSSRRTMPEIICSIRSGSTGRFCSAMRIERSSLSRSKSSRRPIGLDDDQVAQLHPLVGGESAAAGRAEAAPPDRYMVLGGARILHLRVRCFRKTGSASRASVNAARRTIAASQAVV